MVIKESVFITRVHHVLGMRPVISGSYWSPSIQIHIYPKMHHYRHQNIGRKNTILNFKLKKSLVFFLLAFFFFLSFFFHWVSVGRAGIPKFQKHKVEGTKKNPQSDVWRVGQREEESEGGRK